ncbi:hypothetical protein Tco_1498770, partial [Tanacetum coccineum]
MLNKENYIPWSSHLLRYAKSRPNGKLIYNSIINGPYVKRMIPELGDQNCEVPVNETFHEKTDDELTAMNMTLVLMAKTFKLNYSTPEPQPNNNYNPEPSFNQNYMQQPMPNPEDITDPTTAMNMTLVLMAKTFKLNYSTPTNNNQRISSNPCNWQIAQLDLNEIEEVNANCILMANLQQASTSGTQTDKAPVYDSDGLAK